MKLVIKMQKLFEFKNKLKVNIQEKKRNTWLKYFYYLEIKKN